LILLLITACGSVWVLENPGSSVVMRHDRMQHLIRIFKKFDISMYRQSFWMAHYFHPNFKLTKVWSTARSIWKLDFGPLDQKTKANATTTTKKYINAKGEARFTGTQALKASQYPGMNKYWFQVFFFLPSSIQNLRCFSRWLVVPIPQGLSGSFLCTYREAPKKTARQFTFNVGCCALGFGNGLELVGEET